MPISESLDQPSSVDGAPIYRTREKETPADILERRGELEHRQRQIDALKTVSEALFDHLTVDDLIRQVLRVAIEVMNADVGSLLLHDPGTDELVFRFVNDQSAEVLVGHRMPTTEGIAGKVFRSGAADLAHRVGDRPEFYQEIDRLTGYSTKSMLTAPLRRFGGESIGVVQVLNARQRFDERDLEVLEVLCAHAATSIETAHLAEQARIAEIVNLIGNISHDLKNMLTPIKMGVTTLEMVLDQWRDDVAQVGNRCPADSGVAVKLHAASDAAREEYSWILESMLDAAEKAQARTKEIGDAIKGEIAPPQLKQTDVNEIVGKVQQALQMPASSSHIELRLDLDGSLPVIDCDPNQIFSALYNLANNALSETPAEGHVVLRTIAPPASRHIVLEVEDNGKGMSEEIRAVAFTDAAISTKAGGSGLGTRIVAGVVRRHYGELAVESQENVGTRISIKLPVHQASVDRPK